MHNNDFLNLNIPTGWLGKIVQIKIILNSGVKSSRASDKPPHQNHNLAILPQTTINLCH